jgi:hypothetical protein
MRITRSLPITLVLLFAGCHSSPLESSVRVVGIIDAGGETLSRVIEAPSTASANQVFSITVSTYGNSCVAGAGAEVSVVGLLATITPYDVVNSGSGTCLDYLKAYPRTVQLRFAQAGTATIRVTGQSDYQAGLVSAERSLTVNP